MVLGQLKRNAADLERPWIRDDHQGAELSLTRRFAQDGAPRSTGSCLKRCACQRIEASEFCQLNLVGDDARRDVERYSVSSGISQPCKLPCPGLMNPQCTSNLWSRRIQRPKELSVEEIASTPSPSACLIDAFKNDPLVLETPG